MTTDRLENIGPLAGFLIPIQHETTIAPVAGIEWEEVDDEDFRPFSERPGTERTRIATIRVKYVLQEGECEAPDDIGAECLSEQVWIQLLGLKWSWVRMANTGSLNFPYPEGRVIEMGYWDVGEMVMLIKESLSFYHGMNSATAEAHFYIRDIPMELPMERRNCPLCLGMKPFDMKHLGILGSVCPRCNGQGWMMQPVERE